MPRSAPTRDDAKQLIVAYVTIAEAATALAVDSKTIRRRISDGTLPAVRVGFRRPGTLRDTRPIRIPAEAVVTILTPVTAPAQRSGR